MRRKLISSIAFCFFYFLAAQCQSVRYSVVIDEIMADPSPIVGLPNAEFIEIKNTSSQNINLQGWKIKSTTSASSSFPITVLQPDSFLIITSTTNKALFTGFGNAVGISSFPALNNTGTSISLLSKEGATIHSVNYSNSWFQNDVKSNGGWSLEMIDTHNPCTGNNNWKASADPSGGTPGTKNSVDGKNADHTSPTLLRASATDSLTIELLFNEPVDSFLAATPSNYSVSEVGATSFAKAVAPAFNHVTLMLNSPISPGKIYTVTAANIADCSGNIISASNTARVGLASTTDTFDLVVNEILFNPKPAAIDYVELYNRSKKIVNLKDIYIANRSSTSGNLGSIHQLTTENTLFFPGDFFVISENGMVVKQNYLAKNVDQFIDVNLPSFPDDEGWVVIVNKQGTIVDELHYNHSWHFSLVNNEEGIALERVDYNKSTQNKDNWASAASSVGFGTPSYQNSQFRADLAVKGEVTVTPKTFSPDNDGFDDYATIHLAISDPGYVANITIFDATGRPVKDLVQNTTVASMSDFRWDGLDDKFRKVPVGIYIVYTQIFNLSGKKKTFKNTVVVARRF